MTILPEQAPDIPEPVMRAIRIIIDYLWDDELKSFQEYAGEDASAHVSGHVFVALCWVRTYFEARHHDPQHYLPRTETGSEERLGQLFDYAFMHGNESEPEHEIGDLQDIARECWRRLSEVDRSGVHELLLARWGW